MITGTTSNGFAFSVDENALDDMELFEDLIEVDKGNNSAIVSVCSRFLKNQKAELYDFLRGEDGRVPMTAVVETVFEIFRQIKDGKKS